MYALLKLLSMKIQYAVTNNIFAIFSIKNCQTQITDVHYIFERVFNLLFYNKMGCLVSRLKLKEFLVIFFKYI